MTVQPVSDVVELPDRQEDPRLSVYVAAQLSSSERNDDCEILNISAGGAKIRVPDDAAYEPEVILTIKSHGSFPARVAWRSGRHLGLEFAGDRQRASRLVWDLVENPDVEREHRRFTRTAVLWSGELRSSVRSADCRVLNVSAFGAKVRLLECLDHDQRVTLRIERFGEFPSDVVWNDGEILGISFHDDPEDVAHVLAATLPALRLRTE